MSLPVGWAKIVTAGCASALRGSDCGNTCLRLISYLIVRTRLPGRGLIDVLSWLPWALPGVLISLALLWAKLLKQQVTAAEVEVTPECFQYLT